jgi:ABC-type sugar transport system ATPase subunit
VLGVRPEDVLVEHDGPGAADGRGEASVTLTEPLGRDVLVHLRSGEAVLQALVAPQLGLAPGDRVRVGIDSGKLHLFDAVTQQRTG